MTNSNAGRLILVTGATGHQGGAVARTLVDRGFRVRALTRSPDGTAAQALHEQGVAVMRGDLDDRASVERALAGVHGVFAVQNFWETGAEREVEQGTGLADAARESGVEHFVYSSVGSAHRNTGLSHFESKWQIEEHIRGLGLPHTIFRPVFFMSNWEGPWLRPAILGGTLALPLDPATNFQQVALGDIGSFVGLALEKPGDWLGRAVDLASDEDTVAGMADTFSRVIGRPVEYQQVAWDDYRQAAGDEYHDMFRWFQDVGYEADIPALRREGVSLTSFEQYLRTSGWSNAEPPEPAQ
ncbi:MAG TPA: NmrA/HSCARG family protein [Longimicrobiales bacterium]|nr:NmrA/HSCARG family protein [Longimicrobiales bacterium]